MITHEYLIELVSISFNESAPPDREIVAPIPFESASMEWELSRAGHASVVVPRDRVDQEARIYLADPFWNPCEIRIIKDGTVVWQGPVISGVNGTDGTIRVEAEGMLAYLKYMHVGPFGSEGTGGFAFVNHDQHFIVRDLIDAYQDLPYGNFGLDTSSIAASGVDRQQSYPAEELGVYYDLITALTDADDGFDLEIDPQTREVRCHHPQQGEESDVEIDTRSITSASETRSVAPGESATIVYARSTDSDAATLPTSVVTDIEAMQRFGRRGHVITRDGVHTPSVLNDHAQAALNARDRMHFTPGPELMTTAEANSNAVQLGNTHWYRFDAGLGLMQTQLRVVSKRVEVDAANAETLSIGVA